MCKEHRCGTQVTHPKVGSRELVHLGRANNFVYSASLLLTNAEAPHDVSEPLISGPILVNETLYIDRRNAGVGYLHAVRVHLHHHGHAGLPEVLMDEGIRD